MLAASLFFATMAVCIKVASAWFHATELVFWRGLIGMVIMALWARSLRTSLGTRYPLMRLAQLGGVSGRWFLPLPTAAGHGATLNYAGGVWIAAFRGGALIAWNPRTIPRPARRNAGADGAGGFAGVCAAPHGAGPGLRRPRGAAVRPAPSPPPRVTGRIGEPEVRGFLFAAGSAVAAAPACW
jgi:hypothetical protein